VLGILEGLSEEDLRRPMLPSRWTCAGSVHRLAIDVERFCFRAVVAGEPMPDDEPDNAWQVPADLTARRGAGRLPAGDRTWRLNDLREILLHVIAETATHTGQLDAARELIDGRQWKVLTE
jgi:hypothetical protein